MKNALLKAYVKGQMLVAALKEENGQDLVEYALVVAIVALGATAAMGTLANVIGNTFNTIDNKLNNAL
jgi:pilus assembly protein Flp/PilA